MNSTAAIPAVLLAALALSGCREQAPPPAAPPSPAETASPALPAGLFSTSKPAEVRPIAAARAAAKPGDTISIEGYIGGRAKPFTEGRAIFLLADATKAPPCDDGCKTPWDACCESPEDIIANSATIQVVDADGLPLKVSLEGANGLKSGAAVSVTGKVREAGERVFIIDATGITLAKP